MNRDVQDLLREVRSYGFACALGGNGHYRIFHNGKPVVDDEGPVSIPSTPSDRRWRDNTIARLRRARVLPYPKGAMEIARDTIEKRRQAGEVPPAKPDVVFTFEDAVTLWAARETIVEATGAQYPLVDHLIEKIEQAAGIGYEP